MNYAITDLASSDIHSWKTTLDSLLDTLDPDPTIAAIRSGTDGESTISARDTYLRANHTALAGDHANLNGRPRFEVLVASLAMRDAKWKKGHPLPAGNANKAHRLADIIKASFLPIAWLTDELGRVISENGPVTTEAASVVAGLIDDLDAAGSVLTLNDRGDRCGFALSTEYDGFLASSFGKQILGFD